MSEKRAKPSIHHLSSKTGTAREDVRKWLAQAGIDLQNLNWESEPAYVEVIKGHKKDAPVADDPKMCDKHGTPWSVVKTREEAKKLTRENMIAEKVLADEWLRVDAHLQIMSALTSRLETLPDTLKARLPLTSAQRDRVREEIDQMRKDAAAELERELLGAKKKVQESKS